MAQQPPPSATALSAYTALPITLPALPAYPHRAVHYLYLRADAPRTPTPDTARSVFASNVPVDACEHSLRALFQQLGGRVERVRFEDDEERARRRGHGMLVKGDKVVDVDDGAVAGGRKRKRKRGADEDDEEELLGLPETWERRVRKSGSSAVVVFVDRASAEAVLKECGRVARKRVEIVWRPVGEWGEKRYKTHHALTFPPREQLKDNINTYLTQYAALEALRTKQLARKRSEPDEDGFITVTRGGRTGPARLEEAQAAAERLKARDEKRVGKAFYRFQTREERKKRERELKMKFEADVKRVQDLRIRRGRIEPE